MEAWEAHLRGSAPGFSSEEHSVLTQRPHVACINPTEGWGTILLCEEEVLSSKVHREGLSS